MYSRKNTVLILICMDLAAVWSNVNPWHTDVPSATPIITQRSNADCTHLSSPLKRLLPSPNSQPQLSLYSTVTTPILPQKLKQFLRSFPFSSFLCTGFTHGFHVPHFSLRMSFTNHNHQSALLHQDFLDQYISRELSARRISGPFRTPPHPHFISSPLGVIPKKEPGAFRVIHDLSYPKGRAVNDLISDSLTSVQYEDFDHVAKLIFMAGRGAFISKVDIQNAFRIIPIHPNEHHLFGFSWRNLLYVDNCLPMGCSISCSLFEIFSSAIQHALISYYSFHSLSHILDDFIFIGPSNSTLCQYQLDVFLQISHFTGIPIKESKTIPPSHIVTVHGIEVDTNLLQARLPADKLELFRERLLSFVRRRSATLKEWQSLIGILSFSCKVIHPGRPFLRRLIDFTRGVTNAHHHIKVSSSVRHDCRMWLYFLHSHNGVSLIRDWVSITSVSLSLYTDASNWGYAGVFGDRWFQYQWPHTWVSQHINAREFFPIFVAVSLWGSVWAGKEIIFYSDNYAVVQVINAATTKDLLMLRILRAITLFSLQFDISIYARHIPGVHNTIADSLSRFQATPTLCKTFNLQQSPAPFDHNLALQILQLDFYYLQR